MSDSAVRWYEDNAEHIAPRYEALDSARLHEAIVPFLPRPGGTVLDVGAGTGRDADWFARLGHDVIAVEPCSSLRSIGEGRHPSPRIRWFDDRLPGLSTLHQQGLSFDFILLSAVWAHVPPTDRQRAFRKLVTLLRAGGTMSMTLRHGPREEDRNFHEVSVSEIEHLARDHGSVVLKTIQNQPDHSGRSDITWSTVVLRMPDDGTGALPLLRHVILNEDKSSTYKLRLLRSLCRVADLYTGASSVEEDGHVELPLGLVALVWLRLYEPLLSQGISQTTSRGHGFVKDSYRWLADRSILTDLRLGNEFLAEGAVHVHAALRDACRTIAEMPARYITYTSDQPVFPIIRGSNTRTPSKVRLVSDYLRSFGAIRVPVHIWSAMQRFSAWIEPALTAEWTRLLRSWRPTDAAPIDGEVLAKALRWKQPGRDVSLVSSLAGALQATGALSCVWTAKRLTTLNLDVDHCLPYSVWPCDDLWNLVPADRTFNQKVKRDRLPGPILLEESRPSIEKWWQSAYLQSPALEERFRVESSVTLGLPILDWRFGEVFERLAIRRLRLVHDQQVPQFEVHDAVGSP